MPEPRSPSSFIGPTWGADVTRQALRGLVVFIAVRRRPHGALLPHLEDVARGDHRARRTTSSSPPASTRRSASRSRRRPSSASSRSSATRCTTPSWCSTRSGRTRRKTGDESRRTFARVGQPRRQPDPGPLDQHRRRRRPAGRRDPLHRRGRARRRHPARHLARAVRRHPRRHLLDDLHRGAAVRAAARGRAGDRPGTTSRCCKQRERASVTRRPRCCRLPDVRGRRAPSRASQPRGTAVIGFWRC